LRRAIEDFCSQILKLDRGIRFAGIANEDGQMVGHAYRNGLLPLLTEKETEISVLQSVIRSSTRRSLEKKLGRILFSYTRYEKVKRATIPLKNDIGQLQVLMVSFDLNVDPEPIIMEEILPLLDGLVI
jgi:hypothetical protein